MGMGDAKWCLGLPVCRWQRVNGNPTISMTFDDAVTTQKLHDFIYNDILPS